MKEEVLLSTAYFPPAEYFCLAAHNKLVIIEKYENYIKQTYRNRCIILGANGPLPLIVPVLRGSFHKTPVRDIMIDNNRRWRDLHLRSIVSAYGTAPYFDYYYDVIRNVISRPFKFLTDLNSEALKAVCEAIGLTISLSYSTGFVPAAEAGNDFRYSILPKRPSGVKRYNETHYTQVFGERYGFVSRLSIIDVLLNNGPGTRSLLNGSLAAD
jgi:hypothetical protein